MGHWSVKCAVSSLPILAGDEVVCLLGIRFNGRKGDDTGGFVYQPHFFNLLAPPIFGKYDSYGWVEDVEPDNLKFAVDAISLVWGRLGESGIENPNPFDKSLIPGTKVIFARSKEGAPDVVPLGSIGTLMEKDGLEYDVQRVQFEKGVALVDVRCLDVAPRIPPIPDISGDVHWHDLSDLIHEFVHEGYDSTFIHRSVWDNMVKSSRQNFHGNFSFDRNLSQEKRHLIEQAIVKQGGRIGEYHPYAKPEQFFNASLELWKTDLVDTLTSERDLMLMMFDTRRQSDSFVHSLAHWFHFAFSRRGCDNVYVDNLLKITNTPSRMELLLQAQLMFNALMKGGIIVRGQQDLPSEEQDGGAYWPHVAVYAGVTEIFMKQASELEGPESDIPLVALMADRLDESYEFN